MAPKDWCSFCERKSKKEGITGQWYCPNKHIRVHPDGEEVVVQPASQGMLSQRIKKDISERLVKG